MIFKKFICGPLQNNAYVFGDNGEVALIDTPKGSGVILDYLEKSNLDLKYIIFTHTHFDHIPDLNIFTKAFPDAKVLVHKDEIEKIDNAILLNGKEKFEVGGIPFQIIHTPGHTAGGICILAEDKLFSGDTLFFDTIGRTDLPGGSYSNLVNAIKEKLLILPDETAVEPGHGEETTIGYEKETNQYLI